MTLYSTLQNTQRTRVSDGKTISILDGCTSFSHLLVVVWPQLGDFDSLEYAWWIQRDLDRCLAANIAIRAVGIGDRNSGQKFSDYTGFPADWLFVDPTAELHQTLDLYEGLSVNVPGLTSQQNAWVNLMLMCAGIGSPGTLAEVFRGYRGDRSAPQLFGPDEVVKTNVLPPLKGSFFNQAGGEGFQRPFELATLRLKNMAEVLSHWNTYVPDASYLTQRGGTFLFDAQHNLCYEHRDPGVLGFAEHRNNPLLFLNDYCEVNLSTAGAGR